MPSINVPMPKQDAVDEPMADQMFGKILKEQIAMANDAMNYHEIELERAKRIYRAAGLALGALTQDEQAAEAEWH